MPITTDSLGHLRTRERRASTATVTSVNDAATNQTLRAAPAARAARLTTPTATPAARRE